MESQRAGHDWAGMQKNVRGCFLLDIFSRSSVQIFLSYSSGWNQPHTHRYRLTRGVQLSWFRSIMIYPWFFCGHVNMTWALLTSKQQGEGEAGTSHVHSNDLGSISEFIPLVAPLWIPQSFSSAIFPPFHSPAFVICAFTSFATVHTLLCLFKKKILKFCV